MHTEHRCTITTDGSPSYTTTASSSEIPSCVTDFEKSLEDGSMWEYRDDLSLRPKTHSHDCLVTTARASPRIAATATHACRTDAFAHTLRCHDSHNDDSRT